MLLSLTSLAMLLLTASTNALSGGVEVQQLYAGNPAVTPQDPSTLVLALIGAGVLGIYAVARRRPLRIPPRRWIGRLSDQSEAAQMTDGVAPKQSRGAA